MGSERGLLPSFENLESRILLSGCLPGLAEALASAVDLDAADAGGPFALTAAGEPLDDYADTFDGAWAMPLLPDSGSGSARGAIQYVGDVDVMALVAPLTGTMTVDGSTLARWGAMPSGEVWAHDAWGNLLGHDADPADTDASLSFEVVGGQTYYVTFGSLNNATGSYNVRITTTPAPMPAPNPGRNEFRTAEVLVLEPAGRVTIDGAIAARGTTDVYGFTAAADGTVEAIVAGGGGGFDPLLEVFNDRRRRMGRSGSAAAGTGDATLSFNVRAGRTYYLRVYDRGGQAGPYTLTVCGHPTDDIGDTFADARAIPLDGETGAGAAAGRIDYVGDVDMMVLAPTQAWTLHLEQRGGGELAFAGALTVYDAQGNELADDDAADSTVGLSLVVEAGGTYYLAARGMNGATGGYTIRVTADAPPPAPDPTPDPGPVVPGDGYAPGATVQVHVVQLGEALRLVVVGTDAADSLTLWQAAGGVTLNASWGESTFVGSFSTMVIYGFGGNDTIRLTHTVTAAVEVYGGDGDDSLFEAGPGAATLYGDAGDDLLVTVGGGADSVWGGDGLDSIWADGADVVLDASAAETAATSIHQITAFYQPTGNASEHVSLEIAGQDIVDPEAGTRYRDFSTRPVFVDGPQFNDVRQGSLGDCYFLAAMGSLAESDPGIVGQMVAPMGDGTFAVRYYRSGQAVYVRVDGQLPGSSVSPRYARLTPDGELWVALAEKAYAQFRYGQNSYASIEGGWMDEVYQQVTGSWTTRLSPGAGNIASALADHLVAGHAVTVGTTNSPSSPLVGLHAYMVKSVETDGGQTYVTVYNPWGIDGAAYDSSPYDGLIRLTLAQFRQDFSAAVVSMA